MLNEVIQSENIIQNKEAITEWVLPTADNYSVKILLQEQANIQSNL